jgi:hypothetical protein
MGTLGHSDISYVVQHYWLKKNKDIGIYNVFGFEAQVVYTEKRFQSGYRKGFLAGGWADMAGSV